MLITSGSCRVKNKQEYRAIIIILLNKCIKEQDDNLGSYYLPNEYPRASA